MLLKDYLSFIFSILYAERHRVKRLFLIVILGSFLTFFIYFATSLLKHQVALKYKHQYVFLPYQKGSQDVLEPSSIKLVDELVINNLKNDFSDIIIFSNKEESIFNLYNQTLDMTLSVSYRLNPFDNSNYINQDILDLYQWKISDYFKIGSTFIFFDDIHDEDVDLILSSAYIPKQPGSLNNNFITVHTEYPINVVLESLNQSITDLSYEYRMEPFSTQDLFMTLISGMERILFMFSFLIFIVSASNIGTIMPYFVNEFKDEIHLLRLMGLSRNIIFNIFMLTSLVVLLISLLISFLLSYLISLLIALLLKSLLPTSFFMCLILIMIQITLGLLFSYQSIKKASDDVTYL